MREAFRFKQFSISDEGCAMKLGTDSVLLGSWVNADNANTILDIGTGCGILALMMAQKSEAEVTGIDLHSESCAMALVNAMRSPWADRINIVESSLQDFAMDCGESFDLIISNPPYFIDSLKAPSAERNLSRHNDTLSHDDLLEGVCQLLSLQGFFSLILPFEQEVAFIQKAFIKGLFAYKILHIQSKPSLPIIRTCISFSRQKLELQTDTLLIRLSDGKYSKEYQVLTQEFYL